MRSDAASETSCFFARSVKNWAIARGVATLSSLESKATWKSGMPTFASVASMFAPPRRCQSACAVPLSEIVIIASSAWSIVSSVPTASNDPSSLTSSGWIVMMSL